MSDTTGDRTDATLIAFVLGSTEALILADVQGSIVAANAAMGRLFQGGPDSLVGQGWKSLVQVCLLYTSRCV